MKSDLPYLEHIADSIAAIESYVSGGREAFFDERLDSGCRDPKFRDQSARRQLSTGRIVA